MSARYKAVGCSVLITTTRPSSSLVEHRNYTAKPGSILALLCWLLGSSLLQQIASGTENKTPRLPAGQRSKALAVFTATRTRRMLQYQRI